MKDIDELKKEVKKFRDKRDWEKYHTPKNLALSISIEASELLELFQWKEDSLEKIEKKEIEEEMADVMIYLLALAEKTNTELDKAVMDKLEKNREKYPPEEEHFS